MMPFRLTRNVRYAAYVFFAICVTTTFSGCTGCLKDPALAKKEKEEAEKKKKKKKMEAKPDFELGKMQVLPSDLSTPIVFSKPGHWVMISQSVKANNFDFQADIRALATDKSEVAFEIPNTDFMLTTERPVPLPKGQEKFLETLHYLPLRQANWKDRKPWINRALTGANGGRVVRPDPQPINYMPTYQYTFLVAAAEPDLYLYIKQLTSVYAPTHDFVEVNQDNKFQYYLVSYAPATPRLPLPGNSLAMTALAYILWDNVDPKVLTSDQEGALAQWLHWGGQLIVSGPDSLDLLRNSFLQDWLPATKTESAELTADDFAELNEFWTVPDRATGERRQLSIVPGQPILGVKFAAHPDASDVGNTGGLVLERRVGRGRIVVTAFPLAAKELVSWGGSFDSFFHNCILRRPRRMFVEKENMPVVEFVDHSSAIRDARFVSQLRYFSRDLGHLTSQEGQNAVRDTNFAGFAEEDDRPENSVRFSGLTPTRTPTLASSTQIDVDDTGDRFGGYMSLPQSGVAGWNDRSGVAEKARESLHDAAGISIPSANFVLQVLAVYLLILVPVNFGVFWLLGRVEWAWISAPFLALIGAIVVVRIAQLDIGFARSSTEVATLEIHAGFPVGHLTRYTALYTSLSTSYDLEFESRSSLALPFPTKMGARRDIGDRLTNVTMRNDRQTKLSGIQVPSNQTEFIHAEQMLLLNGMIRLTGGESSGWEVHNESELALKDACVMRRLENGDIQYAWIGNLDTGSTPSISFSVLNGLRPNQWRDSVALASYREESLEKFTVLDKDQNGTLDRTELNQGGVDVETIRRFDVDGGSEKDNRRLSREEFLLSVRRSHSGSLNLGQLADLAVQRLRFNPGDVRLVAWTDQEMPGMIVRPTAAQKLHRTLVVAHLAFGNLPRVDRDVNCLKDVFEEKEEVTEVPTEPTTELLPANQKPAR